MWHVEHRNGTIESVHEDEQEAWDALMRLQFQGVPYAEELDVVYFDDTLPEDDDDSDGQA